MIKKDKLTTQAASLLILLVLGAAIWYASQQKSGLKSQNQTQATLPLEEQAARIKTFCEGPQPESGLNKETCYAKEFTKLAQSTGPLYAFDSLFALQRQDPEAIGCHLIAHGIGTGSYRRDSARWQEYVKTINPACSYGAIHGVVENYVATLPERRLSRETLPTICGPEPRADCNHIIGHLILVEVKADVDEALELCQVFQDARQREFCLTGVFMEYQTALNLITHGLVPSSWLNWPERVPELEKMCRSYKGEEGVACWEEIVHAALVKFNNDPQMIFDFCDIAQILDGARRCRRHSIGIIAAAHNFDLEKLKSVCLRGVRTDASFEKDCYTQLVASTLSTLPRAGSQVVGFCSSLVPQFQESCFRQIGNSFYGSETLSREEVAGVCAKAPQKFSEDCLGQSSTSASYYPRPPD